MPSEIACCGTGKLFVNHAALDRLQALRDRQAEPFIVRSAYRSPDTTGPLAARGRSEHMEGTAFEIAMSNHDPAAFQAAARDASFLALVSIRGRTSSTSTSARSGSGTPRFPPRPTAFAVETPPAREVLARAER